MNAVKMLKGWGFMILISTLFILPCPGVLKGADIPSVEDVIKGKALVPTIEELSGGKVKIGDLIDNNNVDLVKEYLDPGSYASIKNGFILRMSTMNLPPEKLLARHFRDATERNRGKAVMDENGTVYYEKIGTVWPGGLPYPEPGNGMEVMANAKFGRVWDEWFTDPNVILFVNSAGKVYKKSIMKQEYIQCTTRTKVPPLGAIKGYENVMWKRVSTLLYPLVVKGLGQYTVRYYDDTKTYDTGFVYLPNLKKTMRVSATTWQDNIAGSDLTYGDGFGLQEPYTYWKFKLLGVKFMLVPWEPDLPYDFVDERGRISKEVTYDVGKKFIRAGWVIMPMHIVEAVPTIKHIYGKKVLYTMAWPYWPSNTPFYIVNMYDRQMKLWKYWLAIKGREVSSEGDTIYTQNTSLVYDVQADHMSQFWVRMLLNSNNWKASDITLRKLTQYGR